MKLFRRVSRWSRLASLATYALAACAAVATANVSAQTVDIATSPLYAGATASPNVLIAASFEFPTAGQAYLGIGYTASSTYVGYFDPNKCYGYNGNGALQKDYFNHFNEGDPNGYFYVTSTAVNHLCGIFQFSGNVMNWATMSALDEFRYALTGGNRVLEGGPNGGTLLQRAYLSGCSASISYGSNCSNDLGNTAVPGVPDFYGSAGLFPTLGPLNLSTGAAGSTYINNCKTYLYLASTAGGNCTYPLADQGVYNLRISVCDSNEGPNRTDLCMQYGGTNGKYKPVGTVQRNADKMRFSIFGYLADRSVPAQGSTAAYTVPSNCQDALVAGGDPWNRCRVGGVLRAPMKYVGPKTYDAAGVGSTNTKAEINTDGTLVDDPEGNAATFGGKYSGFINYLNRFGSAVQANPPGGSLAGGGEYKRYDPIGEMYYEAIRYYQNLPPTPQTYQGTYPNQVAGYFPVLSGATWPADPIVQQCANNYIVSIGDTDTWDDVYVPGYAGSPAQNPSNFVNNGNIFRPTSRAPAGGLDAYAWTKKIGVLEFNTPSLTPQDVRPQMAATDPFSNIINATSIQDSFTGSASAWTATYFPAGAAYWANTNEIRPDLPPLGNGQLHTIKTISVDTGGQTRPVWDRQLYLMGKYGGFNVPTTARSDGTQLNPFYATNPLNPSGPGIRSNAEWESSPGSGYPANYLRATSPQALIAGLQTAFSTIAVSSGTAAGAAVTSANLNYGAAGTYVSQFSPARWSGKVIDETVSSVNGVFTVNTTPIWEGGALLTTRCGTTTVCTDASLTAPGNRNIVTTITSSSGVRSATNFAYANLATDINYTLALSISPDTGLADGNGQARLNYLRGYRGDESSSLAFRTRDSVLGDIINSAPQYVGAPTTGITDSTYQSFYLANAARTAAVYVGANDGMLHAFNATNGTELFAYVPGSVSSYLADLTSPNYNGKHEPFVDSIPVIAEAKVNGSFKTVLVSGTGAGAQALFALDVTDPTTFGPSKVIFEFTERDDYDFGNVLFSPLIVKLQNGTSTANGVTTPTYGYFAVVTSYNNERALCASPGNSNLLLTLAGIVFFNSIAKCTNNSQGDSYYVNDPANRGILYILSLDRTVGTPWVLGSNYYKYYFPAINTSARNGLGPVSALSSGNGDGTAQALYFGDLQGQLWRFNTVGVPSAWKPSIGTVNAPQPIFVASPATNVYQPITARPEIGTGPYGSTLVIFGTGAYLGQSDLSTPYATQSQYALIDVNGGTQISRSADLQQRTGTLSNGQITITGNAFTYNAKKGWYIDFPSSTSSGERMVNKAAFAPGLLTFTSLTLAGSVCGFGGGYVYQVNPLTGLPLASSIGGYTSTVGIPGPPVIVDLTVAAGQQRTTGEQINQKTQTTLVSGTSGAIAGIGTPPAAKAPPVGRVSWREITNFNDVPRTP